MRGIGALAAALVAGSLAASGAFAENQATTPLNVRAYANQLKSSDPAGAEKFNAAVANFEQQKCSDNCRPLEDFIKDAFKDGPSQTAAPAGLDTNTATSTETSTSTATNTQTGTDPYDPGGTGTVRLNGLRDWLRWQLSRPDDDPDPVAPVTATAKPVRPDVVNDVNETELDLFDVIHAKFTGVPENVLDQFNFPRNQWFQRRGDSPPGATPPAHGPPANGSCPGGVCGGQLEKGFIAPHYGNSDIKMASTPRGNGNTNIKIDPTFLNIPSKSGGQSSPSVASLGTQGVGSEQPTFKFASLAHATSGAQPFNATSASRSLNFNAGNASGASRPLIFNSTTPTVRISNFAPRLTITAPTVRTPQMRIVTPTVRTPNVRVSTITTRVPTVRVPTVRLPTVRAPVVRINVPTVRVPNVRIPTVSDIRLKRDLAPVGQLPSGLRLYRYRYLWSDVEYVGVIAQEVRRILPQAVVRDPAGFLRVDYRQIGFKLTTFEQWAARRAAMLSEPLH
ncbi:MAG: tail fiber domain-containing protein [Alphaproteobacteria bacterium]|nr:tail fiber domain-containing protein [Alphaproteobacteria bacterium]